MLLRMMCPFLGIMMEMERPTSRCGDQEMGIGIFFSSTDGSVIAVQWGSGAVERCSRTRGL